MSKSLSNFVSYFSCLKIALLLSIIRYLMYNWKATVLDGDSGSHTHTSFERISRQPHRKLTQLPSDATLPPITHLSDSLHASK